jgi:hypothetical protein
MDERGCMSMDEHRRGRPKTGFYHGEVTEGAGHGGRGRGRGTGMHTAARFHPVTRHLPAADREAAVAATITEQRRVESHST